MRHWGSPAAMVWMKSSPQTLTWACTVKSTSELFHPLCNSNSSLWRPLLAKHSNPDHITSFNISTMRHWDSPAAMVWMKSSPQTLTQLHTVGTTTELFHPLCTQNPASGDPCWQSIPIQTNHSTYPQWATMTLLDIFLHQVHYFRSQF
eukprot:scaffold72031_cov42-Cyclotella_meneghiniana.AAC.1